MSADAGPDTRRRTRVVLSVWLMIAVPIAAILAANAHLIYVATTSQPVCVTHVRLGEGNGQRGLFSAAQSSCSLPTVSAAVQR
jgi:hypothetical protein